MTRKEILMAYKEGKLTLQEVQEKLGSIKQQSARCGLSEGQKGIWVLQKMSPGMSAYNIPLCFKVSEKLDHESFKKACSLVMRQYPILNSVIGQEEGVPYRIVQPGQPLDFRMEDISYLKSHEILPYLREKAKEPFSLENGPLMRVHLFYRSQEEHIVLIVVHHIIFDGSSSLIYLEALLAAYRDLRRGNTPGPLDPSDDYSDFVEWEQKMLKEDIEEHRAYWKRQLAGELPVLALPVDHPRPSTPNFAGETQTCRLTPELSKQARSLAGAHNVKLSVVLLGVYKLLLYRYTGQEDLIVGMPTIGRPLEKFDSQIGFFINMIAIRSKIKGAQPFLKFLKELEYNLLDGLDHASYPFPVVVRELNVPREQAISPVFQTVFSYQNFLGSTSLQQLEEKYQDTLSLKFFQGGSPGRRI